jgi:hypothetical protein
MFCIIADLVCIMDEYSLKVIELVMGAQNELSSFKNDEAAFLT